MDSAWLVPTTLLVGALAGAAITGVIMASIVRGRRAAEVARPSVPDGVAEIIGVLESAVVVLDPSNVVVGSSPAALALGLLSNQSLVHPELVELVDRVRRRGDTVTRELELTHVPCADESIHVVVRVTRLGARYVVLLADDRTEANRLDAVRRDFIANISHELKTPIGAVALLAEALQVASDEPKQVRRFAKRLGKEARRLTRITQEIIELSRLQAADAVTKRSLVQIERVVTQALDQSHVLAESNKVALVPGDDTAAEVYGDEALLVVAVHNLITNAIQYSSKHSQVGIGVTTVAGVVEIAVTDHGSGIPRDEIERIFERFYRVDQARSRRTGGSGLGLSIVKHTAQNHGGDVKVWSQLGSGSTFMIRLPEAAAAAMTAREETP